MHGGRGGKQARVQYVTRGGWGSIARATNLVTKGMAKGFADAPPQAHASLVGGPRARDAPHVRNNQGGDRFRFGVVGGGTVTGCPAGSLVASAMFLVVKGAFDGETDLPNLSLLAVNFARLKIGSQSLCRATACPLRRTQGERTGGLACSGACFHPTAMTLRPRNGRDLIRPMHPENLFYAYESFVGCHG